jgi:hypothetical protein
MIALIVMMVVYFLFAVGDLAVKGYSDLTATPILLGAIVLGVTIAAYIKEKNK